MRQKKKWLNDLLAMFLDVGHIFGWRAYSWLRHTILNSMRIYLSLPEAHGEEESHSENTRAIGSAGGLKRRDLCLHKTWFICTKHRDGQTKYISVAFVADKAIHSVGKPLQNTCRVPSMCRILGIWGGWNTIPASKSQPSRRKWGSAPGHWSHAMRIMQTGHWEAERKGTWPCVRVARKCLFERRTSKLTPKREENSLQVSERGKRKREEPC